jgi:adenylate cyclase
MGTARRRTLITGAAAGLVPAALVAALWLGGALQPWEAVTWDARARLLARPSAAADSIAVVVLDQASLDWGEETNGWSWPWPREVYSALVGYCRRAGARMIAFDMLYTEASVYGVEDDAAFGAVLAERHDIVVGIHVRPGPPPVVTRPVDEVAAGAAMLGNVSDEPDRDGIFRRARLTVPLDDAPLPALGLAAYLLTHDRAPSSPVDREGRALLRFSPARTYPAYSVAAVIQSELRILEGGEPVLAPEALRGRYVLFGVSAPGLMDQRPTPVLHVSPGVLVHATTLDNLLTGGFMREAPRWWGAVATMALGLIGGMCLAASGRTRQAVLAGLLLLPLPVAAAVLAYLAGWWWPLVPAELGLAGGLVAGLAVNYATEGRQRRFLKQAFRHYLSPHVVEKLLEDPDRLRLGGERRELTIFFSDLQGFTSISEQLDPEKLTSLLNEFLSAMTDILMEEAGTLDKYEGDAIIAFWNAPLDVPDHAALACRAAVRCQQELARRRPDWQARYGCTLHMRVGLHTGEAVVGNLGSQQHFDYTVLGDAANLASRLEGANKVFGTETMISAATHAQARDGVLARELGQLVVVGRREPVTVYELSGLAGEPQPAGWTRYREALAHCRAGLASEAIALLAPSEDDPAAASLRAQIEKDPDFRGIWQLSSK